MNDSSSGWMKALLVLMIIVVVVTFFGALGLADSGLLNWSESKANAERIRMETQLAAEREWMERPYVEERLAMENDRLRLEQDQANRLLVAETDRAIAFKANVDAAKIFIGLFAAFAAVIVLVYGLLLVTRRFTDRVLPAPPPPPPPPDPAIPPAGPPDLWQDDTFRRLMVAEARRRERAERAERLERRESGRVAQPEADPMPSESLSTNGKSLNGAGRRGDSH